ncbi:MAG: methyltransferase domain-containing protein [Candidatus Lokiarchaeota archaeon]|nr:methyltransferase domain-containing protein [Candidatus Lokiarchaeota archaeon]
MKKKDIQFKYNQTADIYDLRYREIQNLKIKHLLNKFVGIKEGKTRLILDAGSGTSIIFDTIYNTLRDRFYYTGIDFSIEMLKKALKQNLSPYINKNPNINLILADVSNLPFKKDIFDLVLSLTVAQNLPQDQIIGFLKEINSIMKKKYGKLLISFHKRIFSSKNVLELIKRIFGENYLYFDLKEIEDYLFVIENVTI